MIISLTFELYFSTKFIRYFKVLETESGGSNRVDRLARYTVLDITALLCTAVVVLTYITHEADVKSGEAAHYFSLYLAIQVPSHEQVAVVARVANREFKSFTFGYHFALLGYRCIKFQSVHLRPVSSSVPICTIYAEFT